jgi:CRP/FNR family transcriptional regulator, cyclic AMP receptor protein
LRPPHRQAELAGEHRKRQRRDHGGAGWAAEPPAAGVPRPRAVIQNICSRVPSVAQALTGSLAATLRRLTEATFDLVFLDLPRRVAKVLLSQPRGDDGVIRPGMSQEELAHQAGGTRQSVNAALRGFERRGWITTHGRALTVEQPAMLTRFAAP